MSKNWILKTAKELHKKGYVVIPTKKDADGETVPCVKFRDRKESLSLDDPNWKKADMVSVVLGDVLFLDYDANHAKDAGAEPISIKDLGKKVGFNLKGSHVQTNESGDSLHWFFRIPGGFDAKKYLQNNHGGWVPFVDIKCGIQLFHAKPGKILTVPRFDDLTEAPKNLLKVLERDDTKKNRSSHSRGCRTSSADIREIEKELGKINPDCSGHAWRSIIWALSYNFGYSDVGYNIALRFSKGEYWGDGTKEPYGYEGEWRVEFHYYQNEGREIKNPKTIETIFHYSCGKGKDDAGWCDAVPEKKRKAEKKKKKVKTLRQKGITIDPKTKAPVLEIGVMFPGEPNKGLVWNKNPEERKNENGFTRIVKSILYNQEGVFNPDMAFWYSLVLIDYLAGCGYQSVDSNSCSPLYVFTAGQSSDGKSVTIKSGNNHIRFEAEMFANKVLITNVGSAQGLEDQIINKMQDGCDVFYSQDEYGLRENGTNDAAGRAMRKIILDYKSLGRAQAIDPRLLSARGQKKAEEVTQKQCVHFNYFTTTTIEALRGILSDKDESMGFIQRFVGGHSRTQRRRARATILGSSAGTLKDIDKRAKALLGSILRESNSVEGLDRIDSGIPVKVEKDARKYLNKLTISCIESDDERHNKISENVRPVARVRAIAENPSAPVVTLEIVKWAHTVCSVSVLFFQWLIGELKAMDEKGDIRLTAEKLFLESFDKLGATSKKKAKSKREIVQRSGFGNFRIPAEVYNKTFESMIVSEAITEVEVKATNGRKLIKYYMEIEDDDG